MLDRSLDDFARRAGSWSLGLGVDSQEVLEVLVLRLGSAVRLADGFALGRGGVEALWGC